MSIGQHRTKTFLSLVAMLAASVSAFAGIAMPRIMSHRGESKDRPENTMAAFRLAFERGVDGVECDVYCTSDGVPVIIHDSTTKRTAGSGTNLTVTASTWNQLKDVRVGAFSPWIGTEWEGETLPKFEDYLALLSMNTTTRCIVELKDNGANNLIQNVVAAVKAQPLATADRVVFIAFDTSLISAIRTALPDYPAWLLLNKGTYTGANLISRIEACNATGVDINYESSVSAADVAAVKNAGYKVAVWTCDSDDAAFTLAQKGVDEIATNRGGAMKTSLAAMIAAYLENLYFRYDFSDGNKTFIRSTSQSVDPCANIPISGTGAYGQDGVDTAFCITNMAYGTDKIGGNRAAGKTVLSNNWTLAMSLKPGSVDKGVLFSLGRANENGCKTIFFASSSSSGKFWVGTARRKLKSGTYSNSSSTSGRELAHEWELTTSADLTTGYHTIVAVHTTGGSVNIYIDGELAHIGGDPTATTIDTTLNCSAATCVFGNGIQFNQIHGGGDMISGYTSGGDEGRAFQDVRFCNFAFTAEDVAAYAALYPATLPGFSNLDQYAYVQSYGVNGVDTGYKATDNTKFVVDFEFTDVSYKSWLMGASESGLSQTHAIYLNTNKQLSWTTRGQHWVAKWPSSTITGASIKNVRLVENILSAGTARSNVTASVTWYNARTTMNSKLSNSGNGNSLTTKGPSTVTTHLFRGNGIMDNDTQACKAKIYSFEVDDDCTSGVPAAFFAPTTDGNGAAGFTNVVAGTFHGECLSSPSTALVFTPGIGQAEDYRYRSGKFYSRIYASSADATKGLVKFDGGEAAGTNAQFTARGRTAKIVAVPFEGCSIDKWVGDTWAIASGYSATNATIEVKSDTAIHLMATFRNKSDALLTVPADGSDGIDWSTADWRDIEDPETAIAEPSAGNVTIVAHKSFTLNIDAVLSLGNLTIQADTNCVVTLVKGSGSLVTVETIVKSGVLRQGSASVLDTTPKLTVLDGGTLDINRLTINNATKFYIAGAGAGNWPWAICSSDGTMASNNYLADITLLADATIGGPGQLKIGAYEKQANKIVLNNHKLTLAGYWATFRNINTDAGTLELVPGYFITLNNYNNLNSDTNHYSGTMLIIRDGAGVINQADRKIYATNVQLDGGNIWAGSESSKYHNGFGPLSTLSGHGTIAKLDMPEGAVYKPDGLDYLNVTNSLYGTVKVDISDPALVGKTRIPLLKVPTALKETADSALDLLAVSRGWELSVNEAGDGNVCYELVMSFDPNDVPTLEASGDVVWGTGEWTAAGATVLAPSNGTAVVNVTGTTTLTLDGTVSLDTLVVNGGSGAKLTLVTAAGATFHIGGIVLNGNVALAEGSTFSCSGIEFGVGARLTADCDLRTFAFASFSGMLDLAGNKLTVSGCPGAATITSSVPGGVLEIDVLEGEAVTNETMAISGGSNLQVWKTGAGSLTMAKVNSGFGGNNATSLVVKAGVVRQATLNNAACGADGSRVVVEDGAQFDVNGNGEGYVISGSGPDGLSVTPASMLFEGDGRIDVYSALSFYQHGASASNCTVTVYGNLNQNAGGFTAVKSLIFESGASFWSKADAGQPTTIVFDTYAPNMSYTRDGGTLTGPIVQLGDAQHLTPTLDLSRFCTNGVDVVFDAGNTTFQTGSTVYVKLGDRTIGDQNGKKLASWSVKPSGVKFVCGDEGRNCMFAAESDGLYIYRGFSVFLY